MISLKWLPDLRQLNLPEFLEQNHKHSLNHKDLHLLLLTLQLTMEDGLSMSLSQTISELCLPCKEVEAYSKISTPCTTYTREYNLVLDSPSNLVLALSCSSSHSQELKAKKNLNKKDALKNSLPAYLQIRQTVTV